MSKQTKIHHWLSLYFFLLSAAVPLTFLLSCKRVGLRSVIESGHFLIVMFLQSWIGWPYLLLMTVNLGGLILALPTAIGLWRAKRWARRLGFALASLELLIILLWWCLFGVVLTQLLTLAAWVSTTILTCWLLWKSRRVDQVFGRDPALTKSGWAMIALLCLVPLLDLGAVGYLKAKYRLADLQGQIVYTAHPPMTPGFVSREIGNIRMAVPSTARITSMALIDPFWGTLVGLAPPDEHEWLFVTSRAQNVLHGFMLRAMTGIQDPYEQNRHMFRSQGLGLLLLKAQLPLFHGTHITEVQGPGWKGFSVTRHKQQKTGVLYWLYSVHDPHRSTECTWLSDDRTPDQTQIQQALGSLEFIQSPKTAQVYLNEAHQALAAQRPLDAQFALTQAYLAAPLLQSSAIGAAWSGRGIDDKAMHMDTKNPDLLLQLAQVSADVHSWGFVQELTKQLLQEHPTLAAAQTLAQQAAQALKQPAGESDATHSLSTATDGRVVNNMH